MSKTNLQFPWKSKKVLILAGALVHKKVVEKANELGLYTIVTDYLDNSPAKMIADEAWELSITDVDAIVNRCKEKNVDAVCNFCNDTAQKPYQEICERLGLPCTATKQQFEIMSNKRLFKTLCHNNGVGIVPEYSEEDMQDDSIYPIVIKPVDSRGSRGVMMCNNKEEAFAFIEKARSESKTGKILIEKYMGDKQDVAFAFWVINGNPYLLKLGDRHVGRKEDNLNRLGICTELPSKFAHKVESIILPSARRLVNALGLKFGPLFIQGFIDEQDVYYYDPGLRMPGSDYDRMLLQTSGFDTVQTMLMFALSGDVNTYYGNPENAYLLNGNQALILDILVHPGHVCRIEGLEKVNAMPNTVYLHQGIEEGETVPASGDVLQRAVEFGIVYSDIKDKKKIISDVYRAVHVYGDDGEDMIVSRYLL